VSGTRLIAVLGHAGEGGRLDGVCELRLRRAERVAGGDDVVLLSGWARRRSTASEAELMARSWRGACGRLVLDPGAGSTLGNVCGAAELARSVDADEIVLVTSRWHARRARALLRSVVGPERTVTLATTDDPPSFRVRLRELACWTQVPFAHVLVDTRHAATSLRPR
jgi:hypothetical protein